MLLSSVKIQTDKRFSTCWISLPKVSTFFWQFSSISPEISDSSPCSVVLINQSQVFGSVAQVKIKSLPKDFKKMDWILESLLLLDPAVEGYHQQAEWRAGRKIKFYSLNCETEGNFVILITWFNSWNLVSNLCDSIGSHPAVSLFLHSLHSQTQFFLLILIKICFLFLVKLKLFWNFSLWIVC